MRLVVTNLSAGPNAENASVQLVEVPEDSPIPGQPVAMPSGNTVLNLVLSVPEATKYPIGSRWEMTLDQVTDEG